jgi:leucyl aminopeptidase
MFARDLVNSPGYALTPATLAEQAVSLGQRSQCTVRVLDKAQLTEQGFGGILAVGKGSANEPRFISMEYGRASAGLPTICLVGKGLTFDSGGLSLKPHAIGMMGTSQPLADRITRAGERSGERVWQLPLWDEYHEMVKSEIADLKNIGGRPAGSITAGAFLTAFVGEYPFVHLDIAGTAWVTDRPGPTMRTAEPVPASAYSRNS